VRQHDHNQKTGWDETEVGMMIENIKTIAKMLMENNFLINTPYQKNEANFQVAIDTEGRVWLYVDTAWEKHYKKKEASIGKIFHAKDMVYVERPSKDKWPFWAIMLHGPQSPEDGA
jgi:hypothetical protein